MPLILKEWYNDFKRRIIEAFLGSANKEGTIKNGKHLTPRTIIQMIWEISEVKESKNNSDSSNVNDLLKLKELLDSDLITREEFEEQKKKILKQ